MALMKRNSKRKKRKIKSSLAHATPLALMAADQTPLIVFPGEVITSFRHTITRLAHSESLSKRIAMIAATQEEGVTYMSMAMGTTIANDLRMRVCVVELNWWSPGMAAQLNNQTEQATQRNGAYYPDVQRPEIESLGIAGILRNQATIEEALIATSLPNLSLLPAGRLNVENRPIVARSPELYELIDDLDNRFDLLIFDIPPILSTSDAIALSSLATSCYMVVRHGATTIENARQALDDVSHLAVSGVILNQVKNYTPHALLKLLTQA